jgi:acetyltransferase-like isoleucine patch superfamily enzyme
LSENLSMKLRYLVDYVMFLSRYPVTFLVTKLIRPFPYFAFLFQTTHYQGAIGWQIWFRQKVLKLGGNQKAYWPVHHTSQVFDVENILVGIDAYPGLMMGCYIQGKGGIEIGDYTQIAPNVVIVSANHDVYDSRNHISRKVTIGKYCWLGAGCKIMPGVILGDFTIVGAGAVVTKFFPEGHCVIGGVPAKKIKDLDKEKCVRYELEPKFNGYIPSCKFENHRKKHLNV